MKIALAQTRAAVGDVAANVQNHVRWIEAAAARGATFVAFPELSLTGYEPALAGKLAMPVHDRRLDRLQQLSEARGITVALGVPTPAASPAPAGKPCISLVLLQPSAERRVYSKLPRQQVATEQLQANRPLETQARIIFGDRASSP